MGRRLRASAPSVQRNEFGPLDVRQAKRIICQRCGDPFWQKDKPKFDLHVIQAHFSHLVERGK